jgi:HEAT repeat protein
MNRGSESKRSNYPFRSRWAALGALVLASLLFGLWLGDRFKRPAPAAPSVPAGTNVVAVPTTAPRLAATEASPLKMAPVRPELVPLDKFPSWTNSPHAQLIHQLLDASQPLKARRQAALQLARIGTDETMAALKTALLDGPSYLKAMIAEGLGESTHPEAEAVIRSLLQDPDEVVARGAIRGLGARNTAEAAQTLQDLLFDDSRPESIRTEAALTLGEIRQPEAIAALSKALNEIQDSDLVENVLKGLGKQPFAETETLFRAYLEQPGLDTDAKVAALEALSASEGKVAPLLLSYAADADAEVRSAAIWALANAEDQGDLSAQFLGLLKQESEPEVRARLYEAIRNQEGSDAAALLESARTETASAPRLAALEALASACRAEVPETVLSYFNQSAVPELENRALNSETLEERLNALTALRVAGTDPSLAALQHIASKSTDPKIVQSANAALGKAR